MVYVVAADELVTCWVVLSVADESEKSWQLASSETLFLSRATSVQALRKFEIMIMSVVSVWDNERLCPEISIFVTG